MKGQGTIQGKTCDETLEKIDFCANVN